MVENKDNNRQKVTSPYTAAMTGCAFFYYEYQRILPLLMEENADELLKDEIENNRILQVNSITSRKRFVVEFKRRYKAVPYAFWQQWLNWDEKAQRAGLLYVLLKTYKLVFDFHFNVTLKKWNSIDRKLRKADVMMEFSEIASRDAFVDSWTDNTQSRCASQYLTFLRQAGMLDVQTEELRPIRLKAEDYFYYIQSGEEWFLDACLLYPYEINDIKSQLR